MKLDLREFNKLKGLLEKHHIPFEELVHNDAPFGKIYQLVYPCDGEERLSDVVISRISYGHEDGLLEQMGLLPNGLKDDIQGWLDAEDVFKRWAEDYGFFVKGMKI